MTTRRPGGIVVPLATPLLEDEGLDRAALSRLLTYLLPDVDGIFVLGSSGEFAFLRDEVAAELVATTVELVDGQVPVYAGIGGPGTARALAQIDALPLDGVDFVVASAPYYYAVEDQRALEEHFLRIADASPAPVLLYNIPQNTGSGLTVPTVDRLRSHGAIVGIKDSTGDVFQFQRLLELRDDAFSVLQGREQLAAISAWLGADGMISGLANFAPGLLRDLWKSVTAQDSSRAQQLQREITDLARLFDADHWIVAMKEAMAVCGVRVGRAARPLPDLSSEARSQIARRLHEAGLAAIPPGASEELEVESPGGDAARLVR